MNCIAPNSRGHCQLTSPCEKECLHGLAARAVEWLGSPEGKEAMRRAREASDELIANLRKARDIDWQKLHEPFTI